MSKFWLRGTRYFHTACTSWAPRLSPGCALPKVGRTKCSISKRKCRCTLAIHPHLHLSAGRGVRASRTKYDGGGLLRPVKPRCDERRKRSRAILRAAAWRDLRTRWRGGGIARVNALSEITRYPFGKIGTDRRCARAKKIPPTINDYAHRKRTMINILRELAMKGPSLSRDREYLLSILLAPNVLI